MSGSTDEPSWKPAVDAVRKYYNFLVEELGAIPADCVEYPPEEGWSNISEESLAGLEKTKEVVDVLRHLPYIKYSNGFNVQIAFATEALDYRGAEVAVGDKNRWIPHGNLEFAPHVVVLTADDGPGSYGSQVLLDTEKNTFSDYQPGGPSKASETNAETNPDDFWHSRETRPVAEFFSLWEERFRTLEWTVDPFDDEEGMLLRYDNATDEVRQIYRDHGWPDNFRRRECRDALQEWHRTIKDRMAEPGNNLHEINRQPPGPYVTT
ncbi:hypothetical protein BGW36DRAFT_384747 [Talaromyces proteolyticus]|uniref:Uncharacterized protein n=1 Tax=Talaromyces proteolyticus TaxID=1131652 RepID=A0AAD4KS66_9EURO|nr:uncharacterized protein BGW36DRAFT_384747 [Talaromyces proteolyticus]KAH8694322.1 hypothetical protein BGW36DRAFT_384747 [Talaromyces proteolyticus]